MVQNDPFGTKPIPGPDGTTPVPPPVENLIINTTDNTEVYPVPDLGADTTDYGATVDHLVDSMPPATHAPHPEIIAKLDHVLEHLHNLESRIEHLHEHVTNATDCPEGPPTVYEGHVVLHPTVVNDTTGT